VLERSLLQGAGFFIHIFDADDHAPFMFVNRTLNFKIECIYDARQPEENVTPKRFASVSRNYVLRKLRNAWSASLLDVLRSGRVVEGRLFGGTG
jgi:hypothetical protein